MKKIILIIFVAISLNASAQEKTRKEVREAISGAFDSVYLLDTLSLKSSLDTIDGKKKTRNTDHLFIMMQQKWFVDELTEAQKTQINNKITN